MSMECFFIKKIVLGLFFLIICKVTVCQTVADTIKVFEIDDVVVIGHRRPKEVIPVQELYGEQLKKLSVYSVADAVRYFSGVQIKDYGGIGGLKTINIRSMGSHHVGVFYDGIQLGNAQNGVVDLGRFSLDNMEAISMYNGQKSAIFQPAKDFASASAIYMKTRTPFFEGDRPYNLNLAVKGGSFHTINPSLLWEYRITDRLSSSFSAEYLYTSGEYKFRYAKKNGYDTTELRKNGDVTTLRIEGGLFGSLNRGDWKAKLYYYNSERGYPGASVREEPGMFKNQDRQWDENLFVQGSLRQNFGSVYRLLINAKYAYDYLHYLSDPRLDVSTMYIDNRYHQRETYFSLANMFTIFNWWSTSLSTDFQRNTLDADLVNFAYPKRYTLLNSVATSIVFDRFKLQASLLHTYVSEKTETAGSGAGDKDIFTPTLVLSFQPIKRIDLNLRAFYKSIFRMPTLNDLYYTFIGNKYLNPEYTNQYNIGATYGLNLTKSWFKRLEFQADAYYNEVEDKIIAMPTSNQFRWTMLNLGYVEIRGVDIATQGYFRFGNVDVNTRLSYTYQKAQDFTDPIDDYYGGQIPYTPWHSGSTILGLSYRDWDVNYSFIYTGERYEAVANIPENYAQRWYTNDISLSKSIGIKGVKMRITAEANNVFNQAYEVVQCYPMPGFNYKLKLNIIL